MNIRQKILIIALLTCGAIFFLQTAASKEKNIVITGRINGDYQIITDNDEVYEIGENPVGDELIALIGKIVEVKGETRHEENYTVIMATEFKIIK